MSKDKKQNNKKNYKKKEEKITDAKITKATKNNKSNKEEIKESKVKVLDTIEEVIEDEDLDIEEDTELEEDFDETEDEDLDIEEDLEDTEDEDEDEDFDEDEDLEVEEEEFEEEFDDNEDEDLEVEEEVEEIKIKEVKPTKETKKDKKTSQEKIKKIEKIAKEKKVKTKKNDNLMNAIAFLDKNRYPIYAFIGGVLITTLVAFIIWPDRIAALKNGEEPVVKVGKENYTADELYEKMKDHFSVSILLDNIDTDLLTKLYPENEEMTKEVKSNADYYLNMYQQYYGYTEEEFLKNNNFPSYEAFLEYLRLDYRRNQYLDDYLEKNLTDDEIKKYYDENVFGDINTQHVLVEVSTSDEEGKLNDADAKKLAEEIITKLNDGTSWETIQKDYKDKITYEDLGYQSWDASLEESFMTALKDMEDNTYSEEPVKTSYGYHVIYRIDQKETPTLKKAKETIIKNMITDKKADDTNILYKALISLRDEKEIDFKDTVMKSKYEDYLKQYK